MKTILRLEIELTYVRELTLEQIKQATTALQEAANTIAADGLLPSNRELPLQNWDSEVFELKTKPNVPR
jgi:hypothetical protein